MKAFITFDINVMWRGSLRCMNRSRVINFINMILYSRA